MTFEPQPRWAEAPPICIQANLPAFESPEALARFLESNTPSVTVKRIWQCPHCNLYHAQTQAPDPSGQSSGTGRHSKSK